MYKSTEYSAISFAIFFVALTVHRPAYCETNRVPASASAGSSSNEIKSLLSQFTLSNDDFYKRVISPAVSVEGMQNDLVNRTNLINTRMSDYLTSVAEAFDHTEEAQKMNAVLSLANSLDRNLNSSRSASITFTNSSPSAAFAKNIFIFERQNATAEEVLNSISSYKRSPKPDDYFYEYPNYEALTMGLPIEKKGNDTSWLKPAAMPAMGLGTTLALKKCRQIFGWRCTTTLFRANALNSTPNKSYYLFMGTYDLNRNPDNAEFARDGRSKNQIAGSTGMIIVKESQNYILLIGADSNWSKGGLMFPGLLADGYKKDFERMTKRIFFDLGRRL